MKIRFERQNPSAKICVRICALCLCLVDEKGIRFESGTTAITVFDKTGQKKPLEHALRRVVPCVNFSQHHKSGYLPYFSRFSQLGREECSRFCRKTALERVFSLWGFGLLRKKRTALFLLRAERVFCFEKGGECDFGRKEALGGNAADRKSGRGRSASPKTRF